MRIFKILEVTGNNSELKKVKEFVLEELRESISHMGGDEVYSNLSKWHGEAIKFVEIAPTEMEIWFYTNWYVDEAIKQYWFLIETQFPLVKVKLL